MNKRGFTIIELVGVIAIIAVLAAILFPVFARARSTAQRQSCLNNLFNMGMALGMYALDNNGYYPPRDDDLGPLYPQYVGAKGVFRCPVDNRANNPMGAPADGSVPIESHRHRLRYPPMTPPPTESQENAEPEEEPIHWSYYYRGGRRHNELPVTPLVTDQELSHGDKANVLFSDGALRSLGEQEWRAVGFRPLAEIVAERSPPPEDTGMPPGMMGPPPGFQPGMPGMVPPGAPPGAGPGMPPPGPPGPPPPRGSP